MATNGTNDDPPDVDQVTLPSVKTTLSPPPDPPDPGFPNPDTGDLVRRGCLLMAGALIAAWIILMAQIPFAPFGGH